MSYTVTFFALEANGVERVLRRSVVSEDIFAIYRSAPEVSLYAARRASDPAPDGFRVTDASGKVRASFTAPRQNPTSPS